MEILLIDDDYIWFKIFKQVINRIGNFDLKYAVNGLEGRKILNHFRPDIIFLDLTMPVENGEEFLKKIPPVKIPIYILTSSHIEKDLSLADKYDSVFGFYHKPLEIRELISILERTKSNKLWKNSTQPLEQLSYLDQRQRT